MNRLTQINNRPNVQQGFSLIEMMISITIGMMIVVAMVAVLSSNSSSSKTNSRSSELQSNGRYAMEHLKRELRQAGYRGYTWAEPSTRSLAIAVNNECMDGGSAGAFIKNIRQGIWGANDSNPYSANCLPVANRLRGDILLIRHAASTPSTTLVVNTVYLRSSYAIGTVFQGTAGPAVIGTPLADFALQEYVYYIGSDDNDATLPALRRKSLQANSMADEMVVTGIEHMEVQYGRLDTANNTQYFNADGISGNSTDSPTSLTTYAWDEVNSARIWLLVRTAKIENGYRNTNSYVMGDQSYTVNDSYRRQLLTAVVQLRN